MNLHFCSNQDAEDKFEGFRFSQNRTRKFKDLNGVSNWCFRHYFWYLAIFREAF